MAGGARAWLIVLLLSATMAGCDSAPDCQAPNLSSVAVATDAPHENGTGELRHLMTVIDGLTSAPLANAAVRAYWPVPGSTVVYADLRTDTHGQAVLKSPAGSVVTWVASAGNHTQEFTRARQVANDGYTTVTQLAIYPSYARIDAQPDWQGADVTYTYLGLEDEQGVRWMSTGLKWGDDAPSQEMNRRIVDFQADLWWNQTADRGDLGLALGVKPDTILVYQNAHDDTAALGPLHEGLHVDFEKLVHLNAVGGPALFAGPTYETLAAPVGLQTHLRIQAQLDSDRLRDRFCHAEYGPAAAIPWAEWLKHPSASPTHATGSPAASTTPPGKPATASTHVVQGEAVSRASASVQPPRATQDRSLPSTVVPILLAAAVLAIVLVVIVVRRGRH